MRAKMMLCLQFGLIRYCRASAQTAKAADGMSTDVLIGSTNHKLYGLLVVGSDTGKGGKHTGKKKNSEFDIRSRLGNVLIFFIDEYSLIPASMLALIHQQMVYASPNDVTNVILADRCFIFFGDLCQLTLGRALYTPNSYEIGIDIMKETIATERDLEGSDMCNIFKGSSNNGTQGREIWLTFKVHQLTEVNRFLDTAGGRDLARIVQNLRVGILTEDDADLLNDRYINSPKDNGIDMRCPLWQQSLLINPRNALLTAAASMSQVAAGLSQNKTVYVWRTMEVYKGSTTVLSKHDYVAAGNIDFRKARSFRTEVYYKGINYSFCDNKCASLGWINQGNCEGVGIEFHPDEPEHLEGAGEVIYLNRQPRNILVKPLSATRKAMEKDFGDGQGVLKVGKEKRTFRAERPNGQCFTVTRHGFVELWPSQVKTDYNVQCTTQEFPKKILADLVKPPTGNMGSESLLVTLSRGQDLVQLGLCRPLYRTAEEKVLYMEKITKVIELSKDKREELKRMQHASGELQKCRQDILDAANLLGCTRENSYKCQKV
jgi:hypothetical protein